ncbi:Phage portal protein, lambda family [Stieleria neptunia]|uniref:Phage portal protein, lambda family n=1 Tax=Stieleria neptunia TaxID=2527979 RepID=A0A518HU43_9BACT|nr:phage portal protein [Stieleria neptunia]QDV44375.1 Phage portal protein, lambda family [Stieleria neptunia]
MLGTFTNRVTSFFSYDALNPRGRRRAITRGVVREDHHVRGTKRRKLQENAADLCRNLSLAAWMVRRHLDYVSAFDFHGRNEDEQLNQQIERLMLDDSRPSRSDLSGRFGREKLFRLAEARRVLDGDTGLIKLNDGRLQGIQADLIRDPVDMGASENWVDGIMIGRFGRPLSFALHRRASNTSVEFVRRVNAPNVIHYGFFDRYAGDQVRGVSPLVSALNPLRDVYENFSYALAKAKVSQLFALAFYRNGTESAGELGEDEDGPTDESTGDPAGYKVDFGSGPQLLDLDPGDRAEFLESKQPSSEFQKFTQLVVQVALKALDIPYSFYDESHTNFFGSRAAWLHYERSCKDKRDDQIEMRRNYTVWKIAGWVRDGRLTLPRGMRVLDVAFEWVPRGMPWWDPSKEIRGHVAAIKGALDNPQRICRSTGTDLYDNIDQIAKAREYAASKGVSLEYAMEPEAIQVIETDQ